MTHSRGHNGTLPLPHQPWAEFGNGTCLVSAGAEAPAHDKVDDEAYSPLFRTV